MAAISTLTEDWSGGIDAGKWNNWGGAPYVTIDTGRLKLTNNPASTNFYGIGSQVAYDWTNDGLSVEIVSLPALDNVNDPEYSIGVINAEVDANNRYFWSYESTNLLVCMKVVAGSYLWQGQVAYDSAVHKYVRIRFNVDATICYWDYSTDGQTWTNLCDEVTTGVNPNNLFMTMANGNWAAVAGTYTGYLDNVNILPSPVVSDTDNMFLMF